MSTESWRPVVGHEGRYEVSDHGNVRHVARPMQRGCVQFTVRPRLLPKRLGGRANNYHRVHLNNPERFAYVHTLVLEAFRGIRPIDHLGCHRNDDGFDNRLENLYWGTQEDNLADKARNRVGAATVEADADAVPF